MNSNEKDNQNSTNQLRFNHQIKDIQQQQQQQHNNNINTPFFEVEDIIYGKVLIQNQCAIEIIKLVEFQRLKKVFQHGITAIIGLLPSPLINRFDHSIGTMILVQHLGGSEEAQLAALLHDASHTALSHVTDSVFGYVIHEVEKVNYLSQTQIPSVLEKYGFDSSRIFNDELFTLLESPSPQLCADRLDYALRDSVSFGYLNVTEAREIYNSTIAVEGRIVLNSIRAAKLLGEAYLKSDKNVWADGCQAYLYQLAAQAIKLSLRNGSLDKETLWKFGDEEFWSLLEAQADAQVLSIMKRINSRCYLIQVEQDTKDELMMIKMNNNNNREQDDKFMETLKSEDSCCPTRCRLKLKVRTLDPMVQIDQQDLLPLTSIDSEYRQRVSDYIVSRELPISFTVHYSAPDAPDATSSCAVMIPPPAAAR